MIVKRYMLVCDVCGRRFEGGIYRANSSTAASEQTRRAGRRRGWTRRNRQDLCETCRQTPK